MTEEIPVALGQPPKNAWPLPFPRWLTVAVKASETTPLDGALVMNFATRTALRNRHYWEPKI
jgi:hypothetical protein